MFLGALISSFHHSHSAWCEVISYYGLISIFLTFRAIEHLFVYLQAICMSSFEKNVYSNFFPILNIGLLFFFFFFLLLSCTSSLYILDICDIQRERLCFPLTLNSILLCAYKALYIKKNSTSKKAKIVRINNKIHNVLSTIQNVMQMFESLHKEA